MSLIIDGYNLLYVTGIVGDSAGAGGTFQRSREALLNFLAASIPAAELGQTTIVFDAAEAPPGLPRTLTHRGMTVRYASDYTDADALIEQLIQEHHVPRSLLVVSSDHRIQRAARRRRATSIDSERWYSELWQRRLQAQAAGGTQLDKPVTQLTAAEIEDWVHKFTTAENPARPQNHKP
jgi:predicted RNA-binding protein with PIN domain